MATTVNYLDKVGTEALITEIKTRLETKVTHYATMPTATAADVNSIVQFIGSTTGDYVQGAFYLGVSESGSTYKWKKLTYSIDEINSLVSSTGHFEVVSQLPTSDIKTNVIYLVPKSKTENQNIKDEYINLDGTTNGWEKIGDTSIDLSNYVQFSDLVAITTGELQSMWNK